VPNTKESLPVVALASRAKWKAWLAKHHAASPGVWLEIAKKGSTVDSVSYADAIAVALCYGWIDGQKAAVDEQRWRQRFTPRTARSKWSKINCQKATELIEQGEMKPAGLREVEAAKADGRWDAAYAGQRTMVVPDDLRAALKRNVRARAFFETIDSANRYAILFRVHDAKKPQTRRARIEKFVAMLAEHRTLHPRTGSSRSTSTSTSSRPRPKGSDASQSRKASS
jgi:uncharacterized protein YdeI (YjbR/CyaY-like superfamily)